MLKERKEKKKEEKEGKKGGKRKKGRKERRKKEAWEGKKKKKTQYNNNAWEALEELLVFKMQSIYTNILKEYSESLLKSEIMRSKERIIKAY